jgi:hypothetical protein
VRALGVASLALLASCGGSSSETPPPLEPLPVNMHYSRAATTLPGELGTSVKPPADDARTLAVEPAEPAEPKRSPASPTK